MKPPLDAGSGRTTYELTVDGCLGPVLGLALGCGRVETIEPCTVLVVQERRDRGLVEIVGVLHAARLPVLGVLRVDEREHPEVSHWSSQAGSSAGDDAAGAMRA